MPDKREESILEKMQTIAELIEQSRENEDTQVGTINYYKDFRPEGINIGDFAWADNDIYVAKIENVADNTNTYEIYSGKTNSLIATVNEQGKLRFMPKYIEMVRQIDSRLADELNMQEWDFELPQELAKEDRVLTRKERELMQEKERKQEVGKDEQKDDEEEEQEQELKQGGKSPEEEQQEQIAKEKGIPTHSVLFVRENSNFYKDHPNLEPNLYFYRDNDGAVRAEYLDSNGEPHPSQYFEASTTSLRQETVSLGNDGKPVTKEVPYQVMRTKGLNNVDKDIRGVRMTINIDTYGYLEISEARQGKNGEWLSHEIEVKGRDYNSRAVNETTSIRTRKADPDKQTEDYEKVEDTGLAQGGIDYSEMYIIGHTDEVISELIKQGYQKKEAVQIVDYVIGEEKLTFKEAKEKVNKEIGKEEQARENAQEQEQNKEQEREEYGGRTPGEDAWERRERRGM